MQLIGMLDSPYVRRVAISLQLLGLDFEHRSLSVFRDFDAFAAINPLVKAPTLVCDDGTVLLDSSLILDHAEALAAPRRKSLMPAGVAERRQALRTIGLALAACEKSVQIIYERNLRPKEKQHEPWIARVTGQLHSACDALEAEIARRPPVVTSEMIAQDGVTTAVAYRFMTQTSGDVIGKRSLPMLRDLSARAEVLPEFEAAPHGATTFQPKR